MTARVLIRKYRGPEDDAQVHAIVNGGTMSTVFSFFIASATREFVSQAVLMLSAVLFIVVGLPLHYSLLALPITFGLLYLIVWVGHRLKITSHEDMMNIKSFYIDGDRSGFWVAELLSDESTAVKTPKDTDYKIIHESERGLKKSDLERSQGGGRIIGTVAVCVKDDPDMRDPPGTVAWLRRMAVDPRHHLRGVGSALVDAAVSHCKAKGFSAVELVTSEHHEKARSLYHKKGFELSGSYQKRFAGGLVGVFMFQLTKKLLSD